MSNTNTGLAAVFAAAGLSMDAKDAVTRDQLNSAVSAALAEGERAGVLKAGNDAVKLTGEATMAANTRAKSIMDHAEAKGREGMARHLAFDTDMSAESAIAAMKAAPKGVTQSRLQGQVPDPQLSADEPPNSDNASASWDAATADINKRYGIGK